MKEDLVERLLKRAEIRRQIPTRKSVQEGKPDRIADLIEEAAKEIKLLRSEIENFRLRIDNFERIHQEKIDQGGY